MSAKIETSRSKSVRQMAFVLLDRPLTLDKQKLMDAFVVAWRGVPIKFWPHKDSTSPNILEVDGIVLAIMIVDYSLPAGWEPAALRAGRRWADANETFIQHRAHIVVAPVENTNNPLKTARVMTAAIFALMQSHILCSGVLWNSAVATSRTEFLKEAKLAFSDYPNFPFTLWIDLHLFTDSRNDIIVSHTFGLQNFVGREIELEARQGSSVEIMNKTCAFLAYLIQNKDAVKSGDTIGISEEERITVDLVESKRFLNTKVYLANLEAN